MSETKGETSKAHEVKLTSSIQQAYWTGTAAAPGGKIGLEVFTLFTGNNSDINIEISDKSGKKFETLKAKISGNHFWTEVTVPDKAKDELYAEVKLPKQGLSKKSNSLYLFPPVTISNTKWEKKETFLGDILKIKADIKGLADGNEAEIQIWEHRPDNSHELITKFSSIISSNKINAEWEFQFLGKADELLADVEAGNKNVPQYFYRIRAAGITSDSDLVSMNWAYFELKDEEDNPVPNERYILEMPDGAKINGILNESGQAFIYDFEKRGNMKVSFPDIDKDAWEKV